jgi:uncharacterized protein
MSIPSSQSDSWIFVDTGAYFALAFDGDADHHAALSISRKLAQERRQLITTNFILAETHALLLNRLNRDIALRVLLSIINSKTRIIRVSQADEEAAREILQIYRDKDYSLTDATSFVVMQRLGISTAFALDEHFSQHRFIVLTPP